jgi:hypothetical protein
MLEVLGRGRDWQCDALQFKRSRSRGFVPCEAKAKLDADGKQDK